MSEETADHGIEDHTSGPARLPRFGVVAAGAVSLLLAASLVLIAPIGLFVAPLGLAPVAQWAGAGRRTIQVWGWVVAALLVLSVAGVSLLGAPAWSYLVAYCVVVVLPAASLEIWRDTRCSEGRWVAVTTLVGVSSGVVAVWSAARPTTPMAAMTDVFRRAALVMQEAYSTMGVSTGELELALDTVEPLVPWTSLGLVVGYLVLVLFWVRPRLPALGFTLPVAPFEEYRGEEWLAAGFAATGLGALALSGTPRWVAVNLLIAILILYFVQGLAMIRAHLVRWIGRGWLVRWGVAFLSLQGPLPLLVTALGIADGFFPLRPRIGDDGGNQ
jgi:hypothetical protein